MRFISIRDLRNSPGKVQELLQKGDLALTARGKPVAVLVAVGEDNLEEITRSLRRARAQEALSRIRQDALAVGADRLTLKQIGDQITMVRAARHPNRSGAKQSPKSR